MVKITSNQAQIVMINQQLKVINVKTITTKTLWQKKKKE